MIPDPEDTTLGPFSADGAEVVPWGATADALRRIQKYRISTVRRDGRPHVTPLLATPALTGLCFVSGAGEQKSKNLDHDPRCALSCGVEGLTGFDYVVEGTVTVVEDQALLDEAADTFESNLGWHLTSQDGSWSFLGRSIRERDDRLYLVTPRVAFAYWNGDPFGQTRYSWQDEKSLAV